MFWKRLRGPLAALLERRRFERELEEELLFHVEMEIRKNRERGMDPLEARYAVERAFGGVARVKEEVRALQGLALVDSLNQDLRSLVLALVSGAISLVPARKAVGIDPLATIRMEGDC